VIRLDDWVAVTDLASQLGISPSQVVANLLEFGCYVCDVTTRIGFDEAARVASQNGVIAKRAPVAHEQRPRPARSTVNS